MGQNQGCSCCRLVSAFTTLAILGGGGYAAWFFLGQPTADEIVDYAKGIGEDIKNIDFGDLTGALENFTGFTPDLWNEDPFVGDNSTNVWRGHTSGEGGLYLELWNALDESWQTEYTEAVGDWNNWCGVKSVSLTTKDVEVDNACVQADGVMKVCNGESNGTRCDLMEWNAVETKKAKTVRGHPSHTHTIYIYMPFSLAQETTVKPAGWASTRSSSRCRGGSSNPASPK